MELLPLVLMDLPNESYTAIKLLQSALLRQLMVLESIAIGSRVNSTSQHSIAIGTGSDNASAVKSVAIGPDSRASVDGGVALGRDSVADVAGGTTNKGYNPNTNRTDVYSGLNGNVLTSTTGAVSIGNGSTVTRQLTGLAAGIRDTDAVNVAH